MITEAERVGSQGERGNVGRALRGILGILLSVLLSGTACSLDGLLNSDELPPEVSDPAVTETPEGVRNIYHGTLAQLRELVGDYGGGPFGSFVSVTGTLADELSFHVGGARLVDRRFLPEGQDAGSAVYSNAHKLRGQATQARGLLSAYLPDQPALVGHLYALQGYAEIFLAELYCSGIPLSTLDYAGDFTYRPGSTTEQVFTHAVALFDTALTLAGDSARIMDLARLGRARALLAIEDYTAAAAAVSAVADDYQYSMEYSTTTRNFAYYENSWGLTVPDQEGTNGMDWRTSEDPRTPTTNTGTTSPRWHPDQYAADGSSPIVLASGVEARLIEAEAALQAGSPTWLTILNALRTDGTFDGVDTQVVAVDTTEDNSVDPPDTTYDTTFAYDTLWNAGSGGVDGLGPLEDPGTDDGRVDLLFRERAFWLFLTGHRQGDLRRLIRQYGRVQDILYPVGSYQVGSVLSSYGSDVTLPIPTSEYVNPLFTGCISRGA